MKEHAKAFEAVGALHHGIREARFFGLSEGLKVVESCTGPLAQVVIDTEGIAELGS
jgi:hypothetical protein